MDWCTVEGLGDLIYSSFRHMECHLSGVEGAWAYGWETSTSFHSIFAEEAAQTFHYLVAASCCSTSTWSTWWTPEMKNAVRLKQSCWALLAFGILDTPVRYQLKQNLGDFWKAFVWVKVIRADHQKILERENFPYPLFTGLLLTST